MLIDSSRIRFTPSHLPTTYFLTPNRLRTVRKKWGDVDRTIGMGLFEMRPPARSRWYLLTTWQWRRKTMTEENILKKKNLDLAESACSVCRVNYKKVLVLRRLPRPNQVTIWQENVDEEISLRQNTPQFLLHPQGVYACCYFSKQSEMRENEFRFDTLNLPRRRHTQEWTTRFRRWL